jgi:hypothetical protein
MLASKAAQALFLLRTLTAANVNRLAQRLAESTRTALKDLVRGADCCLCVFVHLQQRTL